MKELEIAFDLKGFQEYFIKYKKKEYKGELAEGKSKPYYIFEKKKAFRKWIEDAECSTIKEFSTAVKTLRQWHEYISNSFKFKLSNGPVEGKNNLIKTLKRISFGFKNLRNFRNRILICELT